MALDILPGCSTSDFVNPTKHFYSTPIPVNHHQLRHLLTSPFPDITLFPRGRNVYMVNTRTCSCTHIARLQIEPRCTASGHGWFCAGGERDGYFAALKITPQGISGQDGDITLPVPPTIVANLGKDIINSITINKIQRPRGARSDESTVDDVVALVTVNDKTVHYYSLMSTLEHSSEAFPFPMNHASISPDSRTMIVVGDKEWAYFYQRLDRPPEPPYPAASKSYWDGKWWDLCRVKLHKPENVEHSSYFTTAWSPLGRLCAAGSEQGFITIFDTKALYLARDPQEAIQTVIPSSRPETRPGAVRTMCFAPDPWDFLIWAENNGRVCVADLRNNLVSRQVVDLEPSDCSQHSVHLAPVGEAPRISQSHGPEESVYSLSRDLHEREIQEHAMDVLLGSTDSTESQAAADYLSRFAARSAQRFGHRAPEPITADGLTDDERAILHGLRTSSRRDHMLSRRESALHQREVLRLQRLQAAEMAGERRQALHDGNSYPTETQWVPAHSRTDPTGSSEASLLRELSGSRYREWLRDPETIRLGSPPTPDQPRRRGSIVIASSTNTLDPTTDPRTTSPGQFNLPSNWSTTDPWRTIEAAYSAPDDQVSGSGRANDTIPRPEMSLSPILSTTSTASPEQERGPSTAALLGSRVLSDDVILERRGHSGVTSGDPTALLRARERLVDRYRNVQASAATDIHAGSRLRQANRAAELDLWRAQRNMMAGSGFEDPSWGPGSAGVAMSEDGRTLYVGTELGIFEMKMNFETRKFWAAVESR